MRFEQITRGHQACQIAGTCVDVCDLVAAVAVKVMVMVLVHFIAIGLTWQRNHIDHSVRNQAFDIAVDRGQAKVRYRLLSLGEQLLGQKGPAESGERILDCSALFC